MASATVFLFAHQDDEMGVFREIEAVVERGERPVCVYLTSGAFGAATPEIRNAESSKVLSALGVAEVDIHPLGTKLQIPDGHLVDYLGPVSDGVDQILVGLTVVARVIVHAWEGGHQDHDAAHIIGLATAVRFGLLGKSRQFAFYRAVAGSALPYGVFRPLPSNGTLHTTRIPAAKALRYLHHCLSYRSQLRAILGLLPFMLFDWLFGGAQKLQPLSLLRVHEQPHPGRLLYESRGRFSYDAFQRAAADFVAQHLCSPGTA